MTPAPILDEEIQSKAEVAASERRSSSWDIRNAPRNYITLVLTQFGSALFSFAAVWLITRHLGSEGYGGIVAIVAASQVAQVLVNWTSVAAVRFGVDEFIETQRIARTFWVRLIVVVVNLALAAALSYLWFPPLASWLKLSPDTVWLVLGHFTAAVFWIHVQMGLQAAKMTQMQGGLLMLERLLIFVGLVGLVAANSLTGTTALVCYIAAPAVMIVLGTGLLRRYIFAPFTIDRAFLGKIFAFSLPLLPYSLVGYFSGAYIDAIFVSHYLSTRDLGIYSVATQISGIVLQLPTLANTLLLPLFVTLHRESDHQRTSNYFQNVLPGLTLLWGLLCTGVSFVAYFAIPLLFGPEFEVSVLPLWILIVASAVSLPALMGYFPWLQSVSATYVTMIGAVFAAVANIAANLVLIPRYGLIGCAWATVISYAVNVLVSGMFSKRLNGIPFSFSLLAISPSIVGALYVSLTGDAISSALVCVFAAVFLGYVYRDSMLITVEFVLSSWRKLKS